MSVKDIARDFLRESLEAFYDYDSTYEHIADLADANGIDPSDLWRAFKEVMKEVRTLLKAKMEVGQ